MKSLKRPNLQVSAEDRELLTKIKRVYSLHKGTYGAKRIAKYLSAKGTLVNHKKVAHIMREANLNATVRRPKTTKESKVKSAGYVYENLLNRDFHTTYPNQKWVTDMTEVWVEDKKFYVSALMDLFNRELLALQVSSSPYTELIKATIETAQKRRKLKSLEAVIIHSDQGSVYRSLDYNKLAKKLLLTSSMSRKANCWDNAIIESFFSHFKTEFPCFFEVKLSSFTQNLKGSVHYYNEKRIQQKLGFVSPKDYYKNHHKLS